MITRSSSFLTPTKKVLKKSVTKKKTTTKSASRKTTKKKRSRKTSKKKIGPKVDKEQKAFLDSVFNRSGVYILTNHATKTTKMTVKIGVAKDLHDRIGSYLLCYPKGMHVFHIFFTRNRKQAFQLEKTVHRYLTAKHKFIVANHSHAEESFDLDMGEVNRLIEVIQANADTRDGKGKNMFPYTNDIVGMFIDQNLANGGTRISPMSKDQKSDIDANVPKGIMTSVKKQKKKSVPLPVKKGDKTRRRLGIV